MRDEMAALDQFVAPGLRLWVLIALVAGVLLVMVVIVCCFVRIRIPRTKRQIELIAAQRKMRKAAAHGGGIGGGAGAGGGAEHQEDYRGQTIVMNSLIRPHQHGGGHQHVNKKDHSGQPLVSRSVPV